MNILKAIVPGIICCCLHPSGATSETSVPVAEIMNSFKVAIPRTANGELPEGKGEILGHPFTFTHSNVDASKPFNLAIFSNDLNRNDAFSAAVLLTSTLCLVKHKKSVGLYPKNTHAVEGTHQYEYVGSCSRK